MQKGFEPERLSELERYGIIEGLEEEAYNAYTRLACALFDVPMAAISIVEDNRIWLKSSHGIDEKVVIHYEPGLCASVVSSENIYIIEDALTHEKAAQNSLVRGPFGVRFYAGVPLKTPSGFNLGSFCLMDKKARSFSHEHAKQFMALTSLLMHYMEMQKNKKQIVDENSLKMKALAHDLKNPLTIITLQSEMLMDENDATDDIIEMSRQISIAGRRINEVINKRLFS